MYLITASFLCVCVCGRGIISNKAATCFPFLIGCPIEVKKPLFPEHSKIVCHTKRTVTVGINVCCCSFGWLAGFR